MAPEQSDDLSLFHTERISQYVYLPPVCLSDPFSAVCATVLSPLLLTYFPPAKGVVVAYEDVELTDTPPNAQTATLSSKPRSAKQSDEKAPAEPLLLRHVDEYAASFLWATASFLITLAHLNTFPVSILKEHLPSDWSWHFKEAGKVKKGWDGRLSDEGGWWVNGEDEKVEGELRVRIRDFEGRMDGKGKGKGFMRVEGSLLSQAEEKAQAAQKRSKGKQRATPSALRTQQQSEQADG
ncbi:hypothetical protein BDW02DRAFT_173900 [Decorospora gaudefroyi]|uniref:DNA-directed RNA polymerase I subunit RPA43 n=1 Tax=Decorospora gaudefroyi TaxID=184978 RepID=A0A6A5KJA1_9PLEO|nr:hypothetical protein BDW02DRAFT_173900 [Decorospora gaudefroyi]